MNLPDIDRLEAVMIEPGDVVIATIDRDVTSEVLERIRDHLQLEFPANKILVFAGLELWIGRTQ